MQLTQARLNHTPSHLVPHLGGAAANIGTFSCADVYTLARACASALVLWRKTWGEPLVSQPVCRPSQPLDHSWNKFFLTHLVQSFSDPARLLKPAGSKHIEPLLSWLHKRQASHTWNQTVLTSKLVQQETSKRNSGSNIF